MKTSEMAALAGFAPAVPGEEREIATVYCGDLLSWAMGRAPADSAWCTIMGNVNAVAVAHLADVAVLVLCENAVLDEDAEARAGQQGIAIIKTALPAFEAGLAIARAAGLFGLGV